MKINTENSDEAFYKEKYLKNREKLQKAVKLFLKNNDITSEKFETFLHIMNVKHTETVSNMLNIFKSNKNINSISRLNKMDLLLICAL